jgi:hypothetical protein
MGSGEGWFRPVALAVAVPVVALPVAWRARLAAHHHRRAEQARGGGGDGGGGCRGGRRPDRGPGPRPGRWRVVGAALGRRDDCAGEYIGARRAEGARGFGERCAGGEHVVHNDHPVPAQVHAGSQGSIEVRCAGGRRQAGLILHPTTVGQCSNAGDLGNCAEPIRLWSGPRAGAGPRRAVDAGPRPGADGGPGRGTRGGPADGVRGGPGHGVRGRPGSGTQGEPGDGVRGVPRLGVRGASRPGVRGASRPGVRSEPRHGARGETGPGKLRCRRRRLPYGHCRRLPDRLLGDPPGGIVASAAYGRL